MSDSEDSFLMPAGGRDKMTALAATHHQSRALQSHIRRWLKPNLYGYFEQKPTGILTKNCLCPLIQLFSDFPRHIKVEGGGQEIKSRKLN